MNAFLRSLSLDSEVDPISVWKLLSKHRRVVQVRSPWTNHADLAVAVETALNDRAARNAQRRTFPADAQRLLRRRVTLPDLFQEHSPVPPRSPVTDALNFSPFGSANLAVQAWTESEANALRDLYVDVGAVTPELVRRFGDWSLLTGASDGRCLLRHVSSAHCRALLECGAWLLLSTADVLYWLERPVAHFDDSGRVHCTDGPAIKTVVKDLFYLHGVPVADRVVLAPETLTVAEVLDERNTEVRRTMLEMVGWEKFLVSCSAVRLDRRFNDRDGQWEELYRLPDSTKLVRLVDPSTGRKYFLDVPRDLDTCEQAQLWMSHGLDKFALHRS